MTDRPRLTFWRRVLYSTPDLSNGLLISTKNTYLIIYFNIVHGLDIWLCSIAMLISVAWDAVSDPFMGYISDATRSRFGRRRIYFAIAGLLFFPTMLFVYNVPYGTLESWQLFLWMVVASILLRTTLTILTVPLFAMGTEIARNYAERTSVAGTRLIFYIVGVALGIVIPPLLIFADRPEYLDRGIDDPYPMANVENFPTLALFIAIVSILVIVIGLLGTRRMDILKPTSTEISFSRFFREASYALKNRHLQVMVLAMLFAYSCLGLVQSLQYYVMPYAYDLGEYLELFGAGILGGALVSAPFWTALGKHFDKKWLFIAALALFIVTMAVIPPLSQPGLFLEPGEQSRNAVFVMHIFVGLGLAGLWVLPPAMMADLIEYDAAKTGTRREGIFFGVWLFVNKFSLAFTFFIMGSLFEWIGFSSPPAGVPHDDPSYVAWEEALQNNESVRAGLRMIFGWGTASLALLSLVIISFYRLTMTEIKRLTGEDKRSVSLTE